MGISTFKEIDVDLPKIESLEYVQSRRATFQNPVFDITWILTYTGTLFFCVGGAGHHGWLFGEKMEVIPKPPPPNEWKSKMNSVVAAGRIKDVEGERLHLWGSKDLVVQTPQDWRPTLKKILEEQVIPQVLTTRA